MTRKARAWFLAGSLFACAATMPAYADGVPLAIEDVTVVDVVAGQTTAARTVLVEHGRISAIGAAGTLRIPDHAQHVDGHSRFLIPGLVDMHVHLFNNATHRPPNTWAFAMFVGNGITGVREMAALPDDMAQVKQWRGAVQAGTLIAPRVLAAGVVAGFEGDVRVQVRAAAESGADFVKVFSELSRRQWRDVLDEARRHSIRVDGHVPAGVGAVESARGGQRTAEHLMQLFEACSSIEATLLESRQHLAGTALVVLRNAQEQRVLRAYDGGACRRSVQAIVAAGQVIDPTLTIYQFDAARPHGAYQTDPRWRLLRADEQARWQRYLASPFAPPERQLAELRREVACRIVRMLHAAGAPVLAGTDTPMPLNYPGYSLHDELEMLVECGLAPADALRAATLNAATVLAQRDESGVIAPGLRADLVLLDVNPLRDVRNLRRIHAVVLSGHLLRRAQLDALLQAH